MEGEEVFGTRLIIIFNISLCWIFSAALTLLIPPQASRAEEFVDLSLMAELEKTSYLR